MKDDFIVFYEDSELYLGEKEMSAFCQRSSRQLAEAFQSTAIYLDLALDLAKGSPLPFFESKINGAKLAYDRLQSELVDRIGEEKIKVAIKKEKDESAR
jgi:hypothetical protein